MMAKILRTDDEDASVVNMLPDAELLDRLLLRSLMPSFATADPQGTFGLER